MLVEALVLNILVFGGLGAVVALLCRRHILWIVLATLSASAALYVGEMFYTGLLKLDLSLPEYLMAGFEQFGPFLVFSFFPCLISAILVGSWFDRFRAKKRNI